MTELEKRLTDALSELSKQYEREQRRQAEQVEVLEEQIKRLATQVEDLRGQLRRPEELGEDLQQQGGQLAERVELLAADYSEVASVLSGE